MNNLRKGQIISNFIDWLKTKDVYDIYFLSDKDWMKYMKEYKEFIKKRDSKPVDK